MRFRATGVLATGVLATGVLATGVLAMVILAMVMPWQSSLSAVLVPFSRE
jgi:hypothetical protein